MKIRQNRENQEELIYILQSIVNNIDTEIYHEFLVSKKKNGYYLIPSEARWFGDSGEYMGETFDEAKLNIIDFVEFLN
jgi:hypothetical protein